jgi:Holliday junction resolvase RusA-like endonuclease
MGMDPRKLPKELRDKLGLTLGAGGHAAPKVTSAVPGMIAFLFKGDPPRATHHAKKLERRGTRTVLVNSPELEAAWSYYLSQIPDRRDYVAIAGPVAADVTFHFEIRDEIGDDIRPGWPMRRKPDRDNAAKVLFDALAARGYLVDDCDVTDGPIRKRWAEPGGGRVLVYLRSMGSPNDGGQTLLLGPEQRVGEIYPVPWLTNDDVRPRGPTPIPPSSRKRPPKKPPAGPRAKTVVLPPLPTAKPTNGNGHAVHEGGNGRVSGRPS